MDYIIENKNIQKPRADYDSPWKIFIQYFFNQLLEFFLPAFHDDINWNEPVEFLDKELLGLYHHKKRKGIADSLIRVVSNNGEEKFVLLHVEVQAQKQQDFSIRMYEYYCKLYLRYKKPVFSIAILIDSSKTWRPQPIQFNFGHRAINWEYECIKLIDYENDPTILNSKSPIAKLIQAHLTALKVHGDARLRFENKLRLTKELYYLGYSSEYVHYCYLFIDFLFKLPEDMEQEYKECLFEEEQKMQLNYVSSIERICRKEARAEARAEAQAEVRAEARAEAQAEAEERIILVILKQLEIKFGLINNDIVIRLKNAPKGELERIACALVNANSLSELMEEFKEHT